MTTPASAPQAQDVKRDTQATLEKARLLRDENRSREAAAELESFLPRLSPEKEPFLYNLVLNQLEISQKKVVLRSKPRQLGVTLTHRCNILCKMCFYPTDPWDMPEERIEELPGLFPTLESLYWQGGEAFVSKHFKPLFREACRYPQIHQVITTNGLLIDEEWGEMIVNSATSVVFSIDGVTPPVYEKIRAGGKWDDLIRGLNAVNKYRALAENRSALSPKFETIMQFTVMKDNVHELPDVLDFARRHRFNALNINPIQNVFGPENIFFTKEPEAMGIVDRTIPVLQDECRKHGIRLHIQLPRVSDPTLPSQGPLRQTPPAPQPSTGLSADTDLFCYWPWVSLFSLLRGATRPWGWCCKDVTMDLKKDSYETIWNNDMMQTYRQKLSNEKHVGFCDARCTSGVMPKEKLGRWLS
jgi:MoaA/NifB/PqqE/SkfB family radical SAM enzyme